MREPRLRSRNQIFGQLSIETGLVLADGVPAAGVRDGARVCAAADAAAVGVAGVAAVAGADRTVAAHGALRVGPARVRRARVEPVSCEETIFRSRPQNLGFHILPSNCICIRRTFYRASVRSFG